MPHRPTPILILAALLGLAGCDASAAGRAAWGDGRFAEAKAAFAAAEDAAGESAPPEVSYDRAIAALRTGEWTEAENAAERAAARGGPAFVPLRDFVLGCAAFGRSSAAASQAATVEAEPFAFDVAIVHATAARDRWQAAAASRADWPEARRNVERAILRIADLERRKAEAGARNPRKTPDARPRRIPLPAPLPSESKGPGTAPPPPPPPSAGGAKGDPAGGAGRTAELSPEQVRALLDRLAEKEKEKAALRRSQQALRTKAGENDW